jgi:uncharacterized protein YegP (UPF0339 family)
MGLLSRWRKPDKVIVYQSLDGWRYRRVAANGRIVEDSGEAYTRRHDAKRAAVRNHPTLTVEVIS